MDTKMLSGSWALASLVGLCALVLTTSLEVRAQVMTDTRPMLPIVASPSHAETSGWYYGLTPKDVCQQIHTYNVRNRIMANAFNIQFRIDSIVNGSFQYGKTLPYNTPTLAGWACTTTYSYHYWDNSSPPKQLTGYNHTSDLMMYAVCPSNPYPGSYPLGVKDPAPYCPGAVRDPSCPINNPVEAASGTKVHSEVDIQTFGPQPMSLVRYYRSSYDVPASFVGANWQTNWHRRLDFGLSQEGVRVAAVQPDGRLKLYYESNGQFVSEPGVYDQLSKETQTNPDGTVSTLGYRLLIAETDATERYDTSGKLLSVTERNGWVTTLTYSTSVSEAPRGRTSARSTQRVWPPRGIHL